MRQYLDVLGKIYKEGIYKDGAREGMPRTKTLFSPGDMVFDLDKGLPIVTTKKINFHNIITELLWFLNYEGSGHPNIKYLLDNGVNIWNDDAYNFYLKNLQKSGLHKRPLSKDIFIEKIKEGKDIYLDLTEDYHLLGDVGYQYPWLWRRWGGDQIATLIDGIKDNPFSRRHILCNWNADTLDKMALPACHSFVQFNVREVKGKYVLDCKLTQRSGDMFLGVPYDITSYAVLMHILCIAIDADIYPGILVVSIGDAHIYENHLKQVKEQLSRTPHELPELIIDKDVVEKIRNRDFDNLKPDDFSLENYIYDPFIKAPLNAGTVEEVTSKKNPEDFIFPLVD